MTWYSSCNTLQILILQWKYLITVKIQSTQTIQSDLTVSAVSYQYQVPLQFNHITDLRQIESLIDDILNFDCLGGNIIGEIDPTTNKVFAMMISSLSKKWPQIVRIFPVSFSTAEELSQSSIQIRDIEKCDLFVN